MDVGEEGRLLVLRGRVREARHGGVEELPARAAELGSVAEVSVRMVGWGVVFFGSLYLRVSFPSLPIMASPLSVESATETWWIVPGSR